MKADLDIYSYVLMCLDSYECSYNVKWISVLLTIQLVLTYKSSHIKNSENELKFGRDGGCSYT